MKKQAAELGAEELNQLFQYAMVLCRNRDMAGDLVQSSVETYLTQVSVGRKVLQPTAYIRQVLRNLFYDEYRRSRRWHHQEFIEQSSHDISPIDIESMEITHSSLTKIWDELGPQDREILYYWAILGHSTDEACVLLDMPRGTFLSRLHRLKKRYASEPDSQDDNQRGRR